jgi:Asp-tRNA(Asn)/Glu-tRNA(Gln) amidotransferase A subunit family amidase
MTDPTARSAPPSGAGVLELLRLFKRDSSLADQYSATCLEQAKGAEDRLKAFEYLPKDVARQPGPLSGIPVAIKDIIATSDMPTTNGSPIYRNHVPERDAWVVERLRNLGATIFGKTVSTEFAWRHPGPTVNPWNPAHTPGGSSSGSAAAVAAGIVPLALGTQTLGSVIRPAAFNGVVGLKPSFGAIPRTGVHPLSPSLDHVGLFARRVDDVAFALSLLAASSDSDPHGRPLPRFQDDAEHGMPPLERPRLGIVRFEKWSKAGPEQQQLFEAAVTKSRKASGSYAKIHRTENCVIDLDRVMGMEAFDLNRIMEFEPDFMDETHAHEHDSRIKSLSLKTSRVLDPDRFMPWIQTVTQRLGADILRMKGILALKDDPDWFVIQGVHMVIDGAPHYRAAQQQQLLDS